MHRLFGRFCGFTFRFQSVFKASFFGKHCQPDVGLLLMHGGDKPSAWVQRWSHLIPLGAKVLDIACGHGRHMCWLSQQGLQVTGVDRSADALDAAKRWGNTVLADIENGPWPLMVDGQPREFDAVVVTNYLWRNLFPTIRKSLAINGVLIYETFATGNESIGKPSSPEFLLTRGELLEFAKGLRIISFEDGFLSSPDRFLQRIVAVREHIQAAEQIVKGNDSNPSSAVPAKYML